MAGVSRGGTTYEPKYYFNYKTAHPGRCAETARRFRARHPSRNAEIVATYYRSDPSRAADNTRRWKQNWPEVVSASRSRRRGAKIVEQVVPLVVFKRDRWICQICHHRVSRLLTGRDRMGPTLDHVIPLSKGGEHSYKNTRLAHRSCNSAKGAKLPTPLVLRARPIALARARAA